MILVIMSAALISACGESVEPFDDWRTNGIKQRSGPIYDFIERGDIAVADQLTEGVWELPRFEPIEQENPAWDIDPYGEKYWTFIYYSLRHTRHLLAAYDQTGEVHYLETLREIALDFVRSDGFAAEPAKDFHTAAFLSIMLTHISQRLDALDLLSWRELLEMRHTVGVVNAYLLEEDHFQKEYNHGITQAASLLFSGVVFGVERWRETGTSRIVETMGHNVDSDGAQIEQSPFYHFYALRFFWQIYDWADESQVELPDDFRHSVESMVEFGQWFIKPDGTLPLLGATKRTSLRDTSDDELYNQMEADFPTFAWFRSGGQRGTKPPTLSQAFRTAGFGVARLGANGPNPSIDQQTHLVFDSGPYRTLHSDLDALSVVWTPLNRDLLVDSGLYSLESSRLASYFRSTRAHNTVVVGESNQTGGAAVLTDHAEGDEWVYFVGEHKLYRGVRHVRAVIALGPTALTVVDMVEGARDEVRQVWNLEPSLQLDPGERRAKIVAPNVDVDYEVEWIGGVFDEAVRGDDEANDGFYSTEYEEVRPAESFYLRKTSGASDPLVTTFTSAGTTVEQVYEATGRIRVDVRQTDGTRFELRLENLGEDSQQIEVGVSKTSEE